MGPLARIPGAGQTAIIHPIRFNSWRRSRRTRATPSEFPVPAKPARLSSLFATDRAATFCSDLQDLCCLVLEKTALYDTNLNTTDAIAKQGINYLNDHPRPYRWTKTTCLNGIHEAPWNSSRLVQVSVSCPTRIGLIP